jgi:hypothetical protein
MKKLVLLLLSVSCMQFTYAQNSDLTPAANYAASYICTCVNNVYDAVDDDIREVIMNLAIMSEAESDEYLATLDEEVLYRMIEQGEFMADENTVAEMEACTQRMDTNIEKRYGDLSEYEDELMEIVIEKLEDEEDCEFTYFLLLVAFAMEENPDEYNNINNNSTNTNKNVNHGGGGTNGQ